MRTLCLLIGLFLAGCYTGEKMVLRPVDKTPFDMHFSRIGQPGQSYCLDAAGHEFLKHPKGEALFVIGGLNGLLHAWVVVDGQIIDYPGRGRTPLVAFDGERRYFCSGMVKGGGT